MKTETKTILALILITLMIGIAGSYDRAEEILESVPTELYRQIRTDLGGTPSELQIADHYLANKKKYDSLASANGW